MAARAYCRRGRCGRRYGRCSSIGSGGTPSALSQWRKYPRRIAPGFHGRNKSAETVTDAAAQRPQGSRNPPALRGEPPRALGDQGRSAPQLHGCLLG
eukprot:scaffold3856_cov276-Prasinococcus_capsulatus_cf.AAC.3